MGFCRYEGEFTHYPSLFLLHTFMQAYMFSLDTEEMLLDVNAAQVLLQLGEDEDDVVNEVRET
jgi:hypothetical protein